MFKNITLLLLLCIPCVYAMDNRLSPHHSQGPREMGYTYSQAELAAIDQTDDAILAEALAPLMWGTIAPHSSPTPVDNQTFPHHSNGEISYSQDEWIAIANTPVIALEEVSAPLTPGIIAPHPSPTPIDELQNGSPLNPSPSQGRLSACQTPTPGTPRTL